MKRDIFFYGIYLLYEIIIMKYSILETHVLFIIFYKRQDNIDSRFCE